MNDIIYINKKIFFDLTYSEGLIVIALSGMLRKNNNYYFVNPNLLIYEIYEKNINRRAEKVIVDSLKAIIDKQIIDPIIKYSKNDVVYNLEKLYIDDSFIVLNKGIFRKLMKVEKIDNAKLIYYYIFLLSTINGKTKYGCWSQDKISDEIKIDKHSIRKYNSILEQLNILRLERHGKNGTRYFEG